MTKLLLLALITTSGLYPTTAGISKADTEPIPAVEAVAPKVSQVWKVWVTAYTSSPDETDDTPDITAMGTKTRDGIVATNMLPFGTKIKIPAFYGDKIFVVEDRMHRRMTNVVDIWMPTKEKALNFGSNYTEIVIIEN